MFRNFAPMFAGILALAGSIHQAQAQVTGPGTNSGLLPGTNVVANFQQTPEFMADHLRKQNHNVQMTKKNDKWWLTSC